MFILQLPVGPTTTPPDSGLPQPGPVQPGDNPFADPAGDAVSAIRNERRNARNTPPPGALAAPAVPASVDGFVSSMPNDNRSLLSEENLVQVPGGLFTLGTTQGVANLATQTGRLFQGVEAATSTGPNLLGRVSNWINPLRTRFPQIPVFGNQAAVTTTRAVPALLNTGSRTASVVSRGAGFLRFFSWLGPVLAPVGGYVAYRDLESDYTNRFGTTDGVDNSLHDIREHARANNRTLTPAQETEAANMLRSRRGRDVAINTTCTSVGAIAGGATLGLAWGAKGIVIGGFLGSFIPIPGVGTALGMAVGGIVGFGLGVCSGAAIGNLIGSGVKGLFNLFGGRSRRGGYESRPAPAPAPAPAAPTLAPGAPVPAPALGGAPAPN